LNALVLFVAESMDYMFLSFTDYVSAVLLLKVYELQGGAELKEKHGVLADALHCFFWLEGFIAVPKAFRISFSHIIM